MHRSKKLKRESLRKYDGQKINVIRGVQRYGRRQGCALADKIRRLTQLPDSNLTSDFPTQKDRCAVFLLLGGSGGIRTHVPLRTTAFRVRLVMTTSIRFRIRSVGFLRMTKILIHHTITLRKIQVCMQRIFGKQQRILRCWLLREI